MSIWSLQLQAVVMVAEVLQRIQLTKRNLGLQSLRKRGHRLVENRTQSRRRWRAHYNEMLHQKRYKHLHNHQVHDLFKYSKLYSHHQRKVTHRDKAKFTRRSVLPFFNITSATENARNCQRVGIPPSIAFLPLSKCCLTPRPVWKNYSLHMQT
ncbi:hypothetical protein JB92DRAFT_41971 [Gautieria morchelliformis]|nr:hypothetical protein JB92DRAFT_41971 [Gautieria morchelliformis]